MSDGTDRAKSRLRIACGQMEPRIGQKAYNIKRSIEMIDEAAAQGAGLIVLPELCNTGYVFETRAEAFFLSEPVPGGPSTEAWSAAAARHGMVIVAGITERDGDALYNGAVVIGPQGVIGKYRKNHLWGEENLFFEPGNMGVPVFHAPFGRIGSAICYDIWFPETFRLAANQGADLLCVPTNWVPMPRQREDLPLMANMLAMTGAHSNGMFVAAADRVGIERRQPFLGRSLIVGPQGFPIAGPASAENEELLVADVDLSEARTARSLNPYNHILHDRRRDIYG
jgi:N-carbamoylputrescine amidase